eukprot:PhM_4_TR11661/c2_g1_i8/m.64116
MSGELVWLQHTSKPGTPVPPKRYAHAACAVTIGKNQHLLVHGGCTNPNSNDADDLLSDLWWYDFNSRTWSEVPATRLPKDPAPCRRSHHTLALHHDSVYIFGGWSGSGTLSDVWVLPLPQDLLAAVHATDDAMGSKHPGRRIGCWQQITLPASWSQPEFPLGTGHIVIPPSVHPSYGSAEPEVQLLDESRGGAPPTQFQLTRQMSTAQGEVHVWFNARGVYVLEPPLSAQDIASLSSSSSSSRRNRKVSPSGRRKSSVSSHRRQQQSVTPSAVEYNKSSNAVVSDNTVWRGHILQSDLDEHTAATGAGETLIATSNMTPYNNVFPFLNRAVPGVFWKAETRELFVCCGAVGSIRLSDVWVYRLSEEKKASDLLTYELAMRQGKKTIAKLTAQAEEST